MSDLGYFLSRGMDTNYLFYIQKRKKRRERSRLLKFLATLILGGIILYFVGSYIIQFSNRNIPTKKDSLENVIKDVLLDTKGTYGVAVKNLKTGEVYYDNEHKTFDAGSVYKLWVMAAVFEKIQTGEWDEDLVLSEDVAVLNEIFDVDLEQAELKEGTVTFSVRDALTQMITISHNYAALLLVEEIKLSNVAKFLESYGLDESKVGTSGEAPTITPYDTLLFFEKLYKGELADQQYTDRMLELLKKQQLRGKLPKYLPQGIVVAHKTGEIGWFSHDGGIVYSPKGDYIIAVLSESDLPFGANERIAEVSKATFEYFLR